MDIDESKVQYTLEVVKWTKSIFYRFASSGLKSAAALRRALL
jgi:hypothetical protein